MYIFNHLQYIIELTYPGTFGLFINNYDKKHTYMISVFILERNSAFYYKTARKEK